jgi:hypothetical protein
VPARLVSRPYDLLRSLDQLSIQLSANFVSLAYRGTPRTANDPHRACMDRFGA